MTVIKKYNEGTSEWEAIAVGQKGDTGEGIATGGTANQYLVKLSATDFDTGWETLTANRVSYDNTNSNLTSTNVQNAIDELDLNKLDISALTASVRFFPTTAAGAVGGYARLVTDTADADFNDPAADVTVGPFSGSNNLLGSLVSDAGVLEGNTTPINVSTIGNVRRTSGNIFDSASFYFELYKRDSGGNETLIGTSSTTASVNSNTYEEFFADALIQDTSFTSTDRVVLKFYGNVDSGGGGETYQFQYGGDQPVRTLFPVPVSVVPSNTGTIATQDADNVNITGGSITGITDLAVADGGTGASDAATARTNLGLGDVDNVSAADLRDRSTHTGTQPLSTISDAGTIASQDANSVNIDGGTIDGTAVNATTLTASGDVNFDSGTLFVDESTNNVGIGTTSPQFALHVSGSTLPLILSRSSGGIDTFIASDDGEGAGAIGTGTSNPLKILSNNTERMRIDSSGHAIIPAGVTLGTSAGVYNAANTLDDYEEGTWTPVIRGAVTAGTYELSTADGIYTKIGNLVTISCVVVFAGSITGGGTSYLQIQGIPFSNENEAQGVVSPSGLDMTAGKTWMTASPISSSLVTTWFLSQNGDNASNSDFPIAGVSANDSFRFTATFRAL